jgi:hypothetical protein
MSSSMSVEPIWVQSALHFLALVRDDAKLRSSLAGDRLTLQVADLVTLGAQFGFSFDEAALRLAFVYDWQMRMAHWQLRARSTVPAESQLGTATKQSTGAPSGSVVATDIGQQRQ